MKNTEREYWRTVEIHPLYEVSTLGRVRNSLTGKFVGSVRPDGYVHVILRIDGKVKNVRVHTLVWAAFRTGGSSREMVIDHINGNKADNRLSNLQLISFRENVHKEIESESGVVGVCWSKSKRRWRAMISLNNVRYSLGYRKTVEEAQALYDEALRRYEETGLTPDDMKECLPEGQKRCTSCKQVLPVSDFDEYKTCRGNRSLRAKCRPCYKAYRKFHDKKYRGK